MNIQFSPPDITDLEIAEVTAALKSGWITTGPKTKLFEKKIAEYCGTSRVVCLNSATACLELILRYLGIGSGDEVITSAYTYTASASVIHHVGAKIVLVDVAPDSYEIDCDKLAEAITGKTKAVIPVDIGGVMCDYDKIFKAVEKKKHLFNPDNDIQRAFGRVIVIADAAHSFGAVYHDKKSGAVADFTAFSFHAVKNLTTAEGGAVTWKDHEGIDSNELYQWFMHYSLHGQSKDALAKMKLGAWEYDIVYPAYKCNMTDVAAVMGLVQLSRFDGLAERRKEIIDMYDGALLPLGISRLEHHMPDRQGNGHLYLARIPGITESKRNEIITKMAEAGIACNVHFKPLPLHTAYKNLGFDISDYSVAYAQYANEITLPLHTLLTDEEVEYVSNVFCKILSDRKASQIKNEEDIVIERVRESDSEKIHAVYNLIKECGEEMFIRWGLLHWATPLLFSTIREECLSKEVYLVREKETGKPIATFNVSEKPSLYFDVDKKALYMQRIAVSPEMWRCGIGSMIFQWAKRYAITQRCECMRSIVYSENPHAISYLERMGYVSLYQRLTKNFLVNCMERKIINDV